MTKNRCTYENNGCKMVSSEEAPGSAANAPGMARKEYSIVRTNDSPSIPLMPQTVRDANTIMDVLARLVRQLDRSGPIPLTKMRVTFTDGSSRDGYVRAVSGPEWNPPAHFELVTTTTTTDIVTRLRTADIVRIDYAYAGVRRRHGTPYERIAELAGLPAREG